MSEKTKEVKKLPNNCLECRYLDDSDLPNFFCDITCELLNATGKEEIDTKRHPSCHLRQGFSPVNNESQEEGGETPSDEELIGEQYWAEQGDCE